MKTHKRNERGQSLVELSISILILLYLLAGAVEFGLAFFQFVQLRDAAQEGALYASINPDDSVGIERRVKESSQTPIPLNTACSGAVGSLCSIQIDYPANVCEGNAITVRVLYKHKIFMPFIPKLIGTSTIQLKGEVTDTILTPVCP